MTTGPEPRIRTEAGFWRVTSSIPSPSGRLRHEPIEHRERVEWARRALRVVLDSLDRERGVAQALDRAVVEVDLAHAEAGTRRDRRPDHLDLVVLGGDLDQAEL